jgi:hypothetical protein
MLRRVLARAALAAVAAVAMAGALQEPASAGGPPGGGGFGGAECGQAYTPSCTVTAGTPGSGGAGTPAPGAAGNGQGGNAPAATGGGGAPRQLAAGMVQLPAPGVLAQVAVRYLRLPGPVIRSSPAPGALQLVRLPVWLWVAAAAWQLRSQTARVPGEAVTATATPVSAAWSMGDGATVTCHGPGTPYDGENPAAGSPTCGYAFGRSSAGQPGGAFAVTVTITWDITWRAAGGAGGALAPLRTIGHAQFRVAESQALDTSSGG